MPVGANISQENKIKEKRGNLSGARDQENNVVSAREQD